MAPNYQVTRDGEQLKLSSGLVCTVTFSQARAWLAGESEAPTTIYGACSKIEVRDKTSAPWVAVKCGCHVLDLRNIDGLGELVQPTHKPVMLSSSPRVDWSPETHEQIRNVILAYLAGNLAKLQENKRSTIVTCRENRNKIVHEREHHGETETVLALEMAKANEALETAKQALESYGKKFLGANLEQVMETAKRYLNALVRDKIA